MKNIAIFLILSSCIFSCTSSQKNDAPEKVREKQKPEISLEDIQGFWVNTLILDSILPNRSFAKHAHLPLFMCNTIDIDSERMAVEWNFSNKKTIYHDSVPKGMIRLVSDTVLEFHEKGKTSIFKKRNGYKALCLPEDCENDLGIRGGCGLMHLFTKLVFDGEYTALLKKKGCKSAAQSVVVKNGLVTGMEKFPLELYFDNYSGTMHPNRKNDALYLIRDSTYHKYYHWRFSGDTLILHDWIVKREFEHEISPEHLVGEEVLRMVKRK